MIILLLLLTLLLPVATQAEGLLTPAANPPVPLFQDNPIINGAMEVWQRGTSFTGVSTGTYVADRWAYTQGAAGAVVDITRSTNVPTVAQASILFNYSLDIDVTTADASIAAGDYHILQQVVEGYNWRPFAQKPFVFSFWVRDTITGEHAVSFRNSGVNRTYIATYSISTADTWEYKVVLIPASPSAGTWDYTTGTGITIAFAMSAGSNFQTTAGAWQTGNFLGTSTTVNSMSSTSNFFRVTGVKLESTSVANPGPFRPFGTELELCQRYYQKSFLYATTPAQSVGAGTGEFTFPALQAGATAQRSPQTTFPVQMRIAPTMTLYNPSAANGAIRDETAAADLTATASVATDRGVHFTGTGAAGTAIANLLGIHWSANADF